MMFKERVFIVTGGASGLGAACAERLLAAGAKVLVADLNAEAGAVLCAKHEGATFLKTNVAEGADAAAAVEAASAQGVLGGLINCAGIGVATKVLGKKGPHPLDAFARVIGVNLTGSFNLIRLAAEKMSTGPEGEDGERGVIINTASVAAYDGQIGQAAYAASKGGIVAMTLPIARELARYGIRVNTIAPGIFDTPLLASLPEKARQSLGEQVPFPSRLGRPDEFAQLAMHIIENPMLNGEVIRLDGAIRMAPR